MQFSYQKTFMAKKRLVRNIINQQYAKRKDKQEQFKLKSPKIIQNQEILSINSAHFMPSICQSTWPTLWHYTSGRGHSRSKPANHFAGRGKSTEMFLFTGCLLHWQTVKTDGITNHPLPAVNQTSQPMTLKNIMYNIHIHTYIHTHIHNNTRSCENSEGCMKIKLTFFLIVLTSLSIIF